uniref:Protein phosphatase 1 regulatory subunit 18 n=1 Tax=Cavia porcellus TaxID=10141 RepID=A0A286X7E9_CAVPO
MATVPDWKLQLLARRRQEEAAVRGRGKAEQERLSQMPAWKRGLLERRRAKLGLPPGDLGPGPGNSEPGPPEPDESAVLLEAIGPVHQNRFIRQERQQQQQRHEELLAERKPWPLEPREWRPSAGESQDQSPKGKEAREERLSPREARDRRPGTGAARECSPKPVESQDWRQSPGEGGDQNSRMPEAQRWRLSPADALEPRVQSPRSFEVAESKPGPGESDSRNPGLAEACVGQPGPGAAQEQSSVQLEAVDWRLHPGGESIDLAEECRGQGESPISGSPGTPLSKDFQDSVCRSLGAAKQRPSEGWKWTLSSGKAREWTARDTEAPSPKPELQPRVVEAGDREAEEELEGLAKEEGALSRPQIAPQGCSSVPSPLPPEDAGSPAGSSGQQQEEEAAQLRPPPPAPAAPQPSGDPLMSRLFYGVKAGPGVGGPAPQWAHLQQSTPRRSMPPATPASHPTEKKRSQLRRRSWILGGYLRLSWLAKGPPERHHKQLKISFSETALETTYQYPSESSVLEELGPEPEVPSASAALPDDEEDEDEPPLLPPGLRGGLRTKALLVDESCRR